VGRAGRQEHSGFFARRGGRVTGALRAYGGGGAAALRWPRREFR
jgi:hypothetical protein